ncbi:hypothetical protein WMY93_002271 [Mugilogobius chulae]|uniref:Uncharacterized protein n=1 Tax=Mugilogobius chulae TaxID=88201 RepID=A0AAW0Q1N0_9GOBI
MTSLSEAEEMKKSPKHQTEETCLSPIPFTRQKTDEDSPQTVDGEETERRSKQGDYSEKSSEVRELDSVSNEEQKEPFKVTKEEGTGQKYEIKHDVEKSKRSKESSKEASKKVSEEISEKASREASKETFKETSNEASKEVSEKTSKELFKEALKKTFEKSSKETSRETSKEVSEVIEESQLQYQSLTPGDALLPEDHTALYSGKRREEEEVVPEEKLRPPTWTEPEPEPEPEAAPQPKRASPPPKATAPPAVPPATEPKRASPPKATAPPAARRVKLLPVGGAKLRLCLAPPSGRAKLRLCLAPPSGRAEFRIRPKLSRLKPLLLFLLLLQKKRSLFPKLRRLLQVEPGISVSLKLKQTLHYVRVHAVSV